MSRTEVQAATKPSGIPWLGEVPAHWGVKRLKRFARICNGQDQKDVVDEEGAYPVLGSGGEFQRATRYLHPGPSVLLGRKGTIDNPLYIEGPFWTVDTLYYTEVSANVDPRFFYYCCRIIPFSLYQYGSAVPSMTQEHLGNTKLPYPPLPEQRAIAAFLDERTARIDALVARKRRLVQLLKEKRQALITRAVTRGLDPKAKMKESGVPWLGEVPEHWSLPALNSRYEILLGKMLDEKRLTKTDLVPYLRNIDVQWDRVNTEDLHEMDIAPSEYERFTLRPGDLLVCEGGDIGRTATWRGELALCAFQKAVHRVRPRSASEHPRYLFYTMVAVHGRGVFLAEGNPNTIPHLTGEKFRRYRFPQPPHEEQVAIAEHLDQMTTRIDALVTKVEAAVERLQEYRTALISAAVTGKVRVPALE